MLQTLFVTAGHCCFLLAVAAATHQGAGPAQKREMGPPGASGGPIPSGTRGKRSQSGSRGKRNANSTQCSQAVSHPSTNRAQHCLTSVIGRELVYSMWYGRCREKRVKRGIVLMQAALLGCEVRFCQLWNGMIQRGLSAWGIQIGSFAAG